MDDITEAAIPKLFCRHTIKFYQFLDRFEMLFDLELLNSLNKSSFAFESKIISRMILSFDR